MENATMSLLKDLKERNVKQKGNFKAWNEDLIDYYVVESTDCTLRFWNSSNKQGVSNYSEVFEQVRDEIMDGETSGSINDGWNEVQWEII